MLRFLVGTAVRTATRAAVRSHMEERAVREARWRMQQMAGPFALTPDATGESALFEDRRVGFSHALPGAPRGIHPLPGPGEPAVDALIALGDVPAFLRYRLDRPPIPASSAADYAEKLTVSYAQGRTGQLVSATPARPDQLARWSVEAGAAASYALPQPDPFGADFEELTVLVKQAGAIAVTLRYPRASMDWLRLGLLTSATNASLLWDPQRFRYAPKIWPESSFLEPTLNAVLKGDKTYAVQQIAPVMSALSQGEKEAISTCLGTFVTREEPPWAPVPPDALEGHRAALLGCSGDIAFQRTATQALGEVRNMHDLRGLAVFLGRAMG